MWLLTLLVCSAPGALSPLPPLPGHNLHYTEPAKVWDEAFPLGNGLLGALVWGNGAPLNVSLDRTDLWDLRPVPEYSSPEYKYEIMRQWERERRERDLLRLYDNPYHRPAPTKIPAGRIELNIAAPDTFKQATLDISTATAAANFSGSEIKVWIHAQEPVGFLEVSGVEQFSPRVTAPAFGGAPSGEDKPAISMGDLGRLGYPPPVMEQGGDWQGYTQEGWNGFRFGVCLVWRKDGDAWRAAWSISTSNEGGNPLALARERAQNALAEYDTLRDTHLEWWARYWNKAGLRVSDPLIEKQWYLDTYKFGAGSRRGAPPLTLQGPWTADNGELPPWKGDYHHDLNTQLSYWPCYSGNRLDEGLAYLDWLWNTRDAARGWTARFFEMPGLNVPMTTDLESKQIGGWRQYTHSATTAAWLAQHFSLHWEFLGDQNFLRDRAYPYIRECAVFLDAVTGERDAAGLRTLPLSSSPEIHDNRPEAWFPSITNYDLALIRWLFGKAAEMARIMGNEKEARRWNKVLEELPQLSLGEDGRLLVAAGHPLTESHRHFSHLMAIHPLGLVDVRHGPDEEKTVRASLAELDRLGTKQWCGYSFAWLANMAARAKDGDKAADALRIFASAFCLRNSFHCNGDQSGKGYSNFTYRPFTLEGNFAAAAGLQEMLIQSHEGAIELFPAIPAEWKDAEFHGLRARGGFVISARRKDGKLEHFQIESEQGSGCTIRNPFGNGEDMHLDPFRTYNSSEHATANAGQP